MTDPGTIRAYRRLWQAVLAENMRLLALPDPAPQADRQAKSDAEMWVGSKNFHIVCALAGFDAAYVLDRIKHGLQPLAMRRMRYEGRRTKAVPHA